MTQFAMFPWPLGDDSLPEAECRQLLGTRTLGRVGLTSGALPVIVPVEYVYENGCVTFRTQRDAKLRAATEGDVLAFEVDAYDPATRRGWSVLVLGRATVVTSGAAAGQLPMLDDARGDGGSVRPRECHYVRIHCELVRGRRLTSSSV